MESTFTVALIGATATIIAPVLTLFIKSRTEQKQLVAITVGRKTVLSGGWGGNILQRDNLHGSITEYPLSLSVEIKNKIVVGVAKWEISDSINKAEIVGGFYCERFLKFEYKNIDSSKLSFGYMILELSTNGDELNGAFLGYAPISGRLTSGDVKLKKCNFV